MKTTGEIIREYRTQNNISAADVAEKIGVSQQFLAAIENGKRKLSNKVFDALKEIMPKSCIDEIQKYENHIKTPEGVRDELEELKKEVKKYKDQSNISISKLKSGSVEMIQVPVYNSVSAGSGLEPSPEPVDVLLLPKSVAEGCVIINVWGDSMEPTIKDGYAVMVKREIEVANNDIGIFIHEGEALVKRYRCFDGKCYLYSDNQNYPPREIRKNDEFKVCGKVIWIMEKA